MMDYETGLKYAYIFDLDGTLCDSEERAEKFLSGDVKDWDSFYDNCDKDEEIRPVCEVLASLANQGFDILFVTGRPESCREKTLEWLKEHFGKNIADSSKLFMRLPEHSYRADFVSKARNYDTYILGKWKILGAFEDRDQCVRMWRDLGIQCFQVAYGAY